MTKNAALRASVTLASLITRMFSALWTRAARYRLLSSVKSSAGSAAAPANTPASGKLTLNTASALPNGCTVTRASCVVPASSRRTVSSRAWGDELKTPHTT